MTSPTPQARGGGAGEWVVPVLFAVVLALGGAVWVWGGTASFLSGSGWLDITAAELVGVVERLPRNLDQPRAAWPASARAGLPGPIVFYVALAVDAATGVLCARAALVVARRIRRRGSGAQWASSRDLRSLVVRRPGRRRLTIGRVSRRLIAAEGRHSLIVIGPTQSGKTTGLAIPALLEWQGPVLATSVKTDLVRDTLGRRKRMGEVKVYDPTGITELPSASWTPLSASTSWEGARRTAERLARAAQPARASNESEFWAKSGARFLAPLLLAAALTDRTMGDVVRWIDTDAQDEVAESLGGSVYDVPLSDDERAPALAAAQAVWSSDERLRSSLYMTASVALDAYNDPRVADSTAAPDLTPEWLLDGGSNAAFLCATSDDQQRLRPLFVTLLAEVVAAVSARSAATGKPLDPPLLMVLDEAANIAPLPDLDALASTAAGLGIQLVTVVQDMAQLNNRWPGAADTIFNNHRAKLLGAGVSCPTTLQYVSRLLGEEERPQRSTSRAQDGGRSTTEGQSWRPIAPANLVRESRAGTGVLIYGNLPPARVRLRPWYLDRRLRRLSSG